MKNPKCKWHPHYPVTPQMREKYPGEAKKWSDLLRNAGDTKLHGCFTCEHYDPPNQEFADVEFLEDDETLEIPWDTEAAYVNCGLLMHDQTSLKTGCPDWKKYRG